MCYHPQPSELEQYAESVKSALKELQTQFMLKDGYSETSTIYDEIVKGYMKSFQFLMYRRIIGR